MATRSFIAKYDYIAEEYTAIYCHWDGYVSGVGLTLRDHYNTDEKVTETKQQRLQSLKSIMLEYLCLN